MWNEIIYFLLKLRNWSSFDTEALPGYQITCASTVTSSMTELAEAITFDTCWALTTVSTGMVDKSFMMFDFIYINLKKTRGKLGCSKRLERKKVESNVLNRWESFQLWRYIVRMKKNWQSVLTRQLPLSERQYGVSKVYSNIWHHWGIAHKVEV